MTVTLSGLAFLLTAHADGSSLINVPLNPEVSDFNDEVYALVHRLLNKRVLPGITRGSLPLTRGQIVSILLTLSQKHARGEITLSKVDDERLQSLMQLFADELPPDRTASQRRLHGIQLKGADYHLMVDLTASQQAISRTSLAFPVEGTTHITSLLPHVYGQVGDDFAFSTNIGAHSLYGVVFDDLFPDESPYRQGEGQVQSKVPMDAYLMFSLPWFDLQIGRDNLRWGPGYHGALLISENPVSMDMVKLRAAYGNISFTAFTGILEDLDPEINSKYISGNRIEGYLWNRVGLGLSEIVVYGNRFEWSYLNPVAVHIASLPNIERADSRSTGSGDNLLIGLDLRLRPMDSLEIYGEVMVDDGNPAKDFHHWDTKFGILGGIYVTDPFGLPDMDLHAEYAFTNQYAYTHENPVNVYKHFTSSIGHFIGSDADDLWLELRHRFTDKLESTFTYELERHGEGNINKSHPADAPPDDRWTPLSGITQSEHRITLGLNYTAIGRYSLAADFAQVWLRNMGNQSGVNESGREVKLKALVRF